MGESSRRKKLDPNYGSKDCQSFSHKDTMKDILTKLNKIKTPLGYFDSQKIIDFILHYFRGKDGKYIIENKPLAMKMVHSMISHKNKLTSEEKHVVGLIDTMLFFSEKALNICCVDLNLFEMLSNTDIPSSYCITNFFAESVLLSFPEGDNFCKAALLIKEQDKIKVIPFIDEGRGVDGIEFFYVSLGVHARTKKGKPSIDYLANPYNRNVEKMWKFMSFLYNFLLWQQSVHDKGQEVIELDAPTRKMEFGKNSKQLIVPRVIGEGYKPKVIRNYESTGTHASPTTHWRSGHWRQQPFGKKEDQKYKTIWIEPVLVNA